MRMSLFLKIYLTIVASLAVVAVTIALGVHLGDRRDETSWGERRDRFILAMFPAEDDAADLGRIVERLNRALDADIAVFDAGGALLAAAGRPIPAEAGLGGRHRMRDEGGRLQAFALPGGRRLVARFEPFFGGRGTNPLLLIALAAGGIGLAAWPVVRHLTRRLDELRRGVEAWGQGDLVARVPVHDRDEVAAVAASFNRAAGEIERLVRSHRALLANASHELRSPLARLRLAVELDAARPDETRRAEIVRSLAELDGLVEEILLASRLDHVEGLERRERIDLLAVAAEAGAAHGADVSGEPAEVEGDPKLIARMVQNLVQNALRHGAPPVELSVAREGGRAVLSVRDHGAGVPEDERARVFEAFYRPAGRAEEGGGWGLGLALVRQIAARHGGQVRCEAAEGGGARFVVSLPALPA